MEPKIQLAYSYQVRMMTEESLKEFVEDVNKNFIKEKSIDSIKQLKPTVIKRFSDFVNKIAYKKEWAQPEIDKFAKSVEDAF